MDKEAKLHWKEPRQSRSKALVDAILEATTRVLPAVGNDKLTTAKVAEAAGVSVGSLYQYFPSKDALVAAVIEMAVKSCSANVEKKIDQIGLENASVEESVNSMVDFMIEFFLAEREKVAEIFKRAPELGRMQTILQIRRHGIEKLATEFEKFEPGLSRDEYLQIAHVCANSIMGVIQTALYEETQSYPREILARELKIMFNAYLQERIRAARERRSLAGSP